MAENMKEIKTRIALKQNTYQYWTQGDGANYIPLYGEVCFCAIDVGNGTQGTQTTPPTVLFKVGTAKKNADGSYVAGTNKKFSELNWASALAADVYAWAKQSSLYTETSAETTVVPATEGKAEKTYVGNAITKAEWDSSLNNGKGGIKFTKETQFATKAELDAALEAFGGDLDAITDNNHRYTFSIPTSGDHKGQLEVIETAYVNGVEGAKSTKYYDFITPDELTTILGNYYTKNEIDTKLAGYQPKGNYKTTQTVVTDKGLTGAQVLGTLSQDTNGVISYTTRSLTPADIGAQPAGSYQPAGNYKTTQTAVADKITDGAHVLTSLTQDTNGVISYEVKKLTPADIGAQASGNYKTVQTAVSDPSANGNATAFIDTISQDANGVITVTKKNVTIPSITITDDASAETPTGDTVNVYKNLTASGHTLTEELVSVPTKAYVDKMVAGAVDYLGTVSSASGLSTTAGKGDFYRASAKFTLGTEEVHVGDMLIALSDNPAQNLTGWDVAHLEVDTNTWVANTVSADGYVTKGQGQTYKVWATDKDGNPAWRWLDGDHLNISAVKAHEQIVLGDELGTDSSNKYVDVTHPESSENQPQYTQIALTQYAQEAIDEAFNYISLGEDDYVNGKAVSVNFNTKNNTARDGLTFESTDDISISIGTNVQDIRFDLTDSVKTSLGKADTSVQSATFAGTAFTKTNSALSITKEAARTALGLGSAAYTNSDAYDAKDSAKNAVAGIFGYTGTTEKTYAVQKDSNGKAYVAVPWTWNKLSASQDGYVDKGWYSDLNNFVTKWHVDSTGAITLQDYKPEYENPDLFSTVLDIEGLLLRCDETGIYTRYHLSGVEIFDTNGQTRYLQFPTSYGGQFVLSQNKIVGGDEAGIVKYVVQAEGDPYVYTTLEHGKIEYAVDSDNGNVSTLLFPEVGGTLAVLSSTGVLGQLDGGSVATGSISKIQVGSNVDHCTIIDQGSIKLANSGMLDTLELTATGFITHTDRDDTEPGLHTCQITLPHVDGEIVVAGSTEIVYYLNCND